jgi:hypothetical protein
MGVASGTILFDQPATSPDKPIKSASAQKRGGVLRVFQFARDCLLQRRVSHKLLAA